MATIEDVAREAGVSISTVSYALSGKRTISPDTRDRVLAAAERLGYAPKAAARALAARRSNILAVTTPLRPDTDQSAHMAFAMAVTTAARAHDYDTLLLVQDDALEGMRRSASTSLADGIVVLDVAAHDERAELARRLDCPVVFIGLPLDADGLTCVDLDFEAAVVEALEVLAAAGHREVGLLSQPQDVFDRESNYPLRIEETFARQAEALGLRHATVRPDASAPQLAADALLERLPGATAIVVSSLGDVAASLGAALDGRGLRVPEDISVVMVGMTPDPSRPALPYDSWPLDPALTCPVAISTLVDLIEGTTRPGGTTLVPPVRVNRGTVATRDGRMPSALRATPS